MLTFKNYISGKTRSSLQLAVDLTSRVEDPEKFILDFTEEHYPHIYPHLITSIFLEDASTQPQMSASTGTTPNPVISKATGQFNQMMGGFKQASDETGFGKLLSKIATWFGGGGAASNFDKAMKALGKVEGVFNTIKVPENLKKDERFANYDGFVKELATAMESLRKFKDAPQIAALMDQLKKDPSVFQVDQNAAAKTNADMDEDQPKEKPAMDMSKMASTMRANKQSQQPAANTNATVQGGRMAAATTADHFYHNGIPITEAMWLAGVPAARRKKKKK